MKGTQITGFPGIQTHFLVDTERNKKVSTRRMQANS